MNEKHGIGFKGPQYWIYATGRLRPPKLECGFAKPREFALMLQTCSTIARTVRHNGTGETELCCQCPV
jgi:hypothetical protein